MTNLSKIKRKKMLDYLQKLKEINNNNENINTITEIENALNEKKYGLVWEKHSEKIDEMLEHNIPIFIENKDKKIVSNKNEKYNFLLEGDNLHSLKLLSKTHKGKIDVIYIDPPYNTGNKDFIYDDLFVDKTDGYSHSKWLSFMEKRLLIARELLKDNGFILISIDESESSQLRLLCDEIFGADNFQITLHIQVRYPQKSLTEEKNFKPVMEYVYIYSKNYKNFNPKRKNEEYTDEKFIYEIKELAAGEEFYLGNQKVTVFKKGEWELKKMDSSSISGLKETWISGTIYTKMSYGQVFQKVVEPRVQKDGLSCLYKVHGRGEDGLGYRYYTGPQKKNSKRGKMYSGMPLDRVKEIKEGKSIRSKPIDTFYDFAADFGNINHEGKVTFNNGKKPVKMLSSFIDFSYNRNAIILDFFAGSGTTGHAVMQLNKEDGGNRKYILCTNNENKICEEITYQRLKNIQEELPHNLKYYKTDFIPKFSSEEDSISNKMLEHIKELIELEYHIELDCKKYIILDEEENLSKVIDIIENGGILFVYSGIFLSRKDQMILDKKQVSIIEIPEYYFRDELKEVGEI